MNSVVARPVFDMIIYIFNKCAERNWASITPLLLRQEICPQRWLDQSACKVVVRSLLEGTYTHTKEDRHTSEQLGLCALGEFGHNHDAGVRHRHSRHNARLNSIKRDVLMELKANTAPDWHANKPI